MPLRLGRWHIELHQRALHITRLPAPNCSRCNGHGAVVEETASGPEYDICHCWDPTPIVRIPLGPRPQHTEEYPF